MSTQQLRDLLQDAAEDLSPTDLGVQVHRRVRLARRRRVAAGSFAIGAVVAVGSFAMTRPAGTDEGSTPPSPVDGPSVAPSALAPVPASPVVSQPASAVGQPALYAYFRVIAVPHQAAQLRLVVVTARGTRVISGVDEGNAMDLSPDGMSLAVTGSGEDARWLLPIRIVDLRTGGQRRLTSTSANTQPGWSPDSRYVAYVGELSGGIVDARTGALMSTRSLTTMGAGPVSWSPDGKFLAGNGVSATTGRERTNTGIAIDQVDLRPGGEDRYTVHFSPIPGTFSLLSSHAWSPDGSRLYVYDLASNKPHEQDEVISADDGQVISRSSASPWTPWQDAAVLDAEQAALPADHREVAYRPTS